jgi:hypothetical protein
MSLKNWLLFALALLCGLIFGLVYGWMISPVEYVDTTPATLSADFKADYTLMVAETFQSEQNIDLAARRLASLGSEPPAEIAATALNFARANNYLPADLELLQNLVLALQVWQQPGGVMPPVRNTAGPTPAMQPGGVVPPVRNTAGPTPADNLPTPAGSQP